MLSSSIGPSLDPFFDLSTQPFCVMTADGKLIKVNASWSRLLSSDGRAPAAALPDILYEADRQQAKAALERLFPGPAEVVIQGSAICIDGSVRRLSFRLTTVEGGEHVFGVIEQVADTKASTTMRAITEDYYVQILDALEELVLIKGPKSRLMWANKAFRNFYGMTNDQLRGIVDAPFNEPDYTLQYVKDDSYVFEREKVLNIPEEPVKRHDGELHLFRTIKYPHRDINGEVIGTFGISRDLTGERRKRGSVGS